ncbi:nitroreductase family protein [uncultured Clostridium sp.]|uniref:nitroreductase family protein n=1 Tax=uncultured Clostridium sp. TaxID=59620 RepID=UPI0025E609A2|nr:nitroreductase family protein [uncultured Clostridium sp.]
MIKDLVERNRSYRRFYEEKKISEDILSELVDLARLSPCGRNIQGLRYILSCTDETNEKIFNNLFWAGYLKEWNGPIKGERPSAYIIMLEDTTLGPVAKQDQGIAAQSMLLGAVEKSLGGCIVANINSKDLRSELNIDDKYEIDLVIALGYPKEEVVVDEVGKDGSIKYWRDEKEVHHVPKRSLDDLII